MRPFLVMLAAAFFSVAHADEDEPPFDPVYTPLLRSVDRALETAEKCRQIPCPNPDCAAYHAASHELSELKRLIGEAEWLSNAPTEPGGPPGSVGGSDLTLAHWTAVAREAASLHHRNMMAQLIAHAERLGDVERTQALQNFAIDLSKLAANAADILSFKDGLVDALKLDPSKAGATLTTADKVLDDLDFMLKIVDGVLNFIELGDLAAANFQRLQAAASPAGLGLPDWFQKVSTAIQIVADVKTVAANWMAWRRELADIRAALTAVTSTTPPVLSGGPNQVAAAIAARKKQLADAVAFAERRRKDARKLFSGAATALAQVFLKFANAKAESMQKELADEAAELAAVMSSEQIAALAAYEEWRRKMARNEAVFVLAERVTAALRRLNACEKACRPEQPPAGDRVPIETFYREQPNTSGGMDRVPQWGTAIKWFDAAIGAHAENLERALAALKATDMASAKVELTPLKGEFMPEEPIVIRFSGARCLLHQGRILGPGDAERPTISTGGEASFDGQKEPGSYGYLFVSPLSLEEVNTTVRVAGNTASKCDALNCDCDNIEFGLLTGSYVDQCKAWEAESKLLCNQTGALRAGACHETATGPNPVIPE